MLNSCKPSAASRHTHALTYDLNISVKKVLKMRLWREGESHWQKNVVDVQGGILAISQFTLYANTDKGAKPDFHGAMKTEEARKMFNQIVDLFRDAYPQGKIETGAFGEFMDVEIHNDGPTTLVLETKVNGKPQLQ